MSPDPAGLTVADAAPIDPPGRRAPVGAPNVVAIVLDDTGFAHLGCFGSDIATPTIDRLADEGLRYNRFHVTSLCSPTRAAFLTGRNHHAVGMGFLADIPLRFPGYTARIPQARRHPAPDPAGRRLQHDGRRQVASHAALRAVRRRALRPAGPSAWASSATTASFRATPTSGPRTSSRDNHYVDPPREPGAGYHLSEDLAATAGR